MLHLKVSIMFSLGWDRVNQLICKMTLKFFFSVISASQLVWNVTRFHPVTYGKCKERHPHWQGGGGGEMDNISDYHSVLRAG